MQKNYYRILGVQEKATNDEIRRSFRELAKKFHPDKNPGNKKAEEAFKEVQEAYATLSDPVKRSKYDLKIKYGHSSSARPGATSTHSQQQRKTYNSHTYRTRMREKPSLPFTVVLTIISIVVFIYFVSSNFSTSDNNIPEVKAIVQGSATAAPSAPSSKTMDSLFPISNADSPYDNVFGGSVYDTSARNSIYLNNTGYCEAVVCIAEAKAPYRTIRNEYISKGVTFKLDGLPDGLYYAKVYYGNKWNPDKAMHNIKGGFNEELAFIAYDHKDMLFDMHYTRHGNVSSFSSYQLTIDPRDSSQASFLTAEQFFH